MSLPRLAQQDDIFAAYDRNKEAIPTAEGPPSLVQSSIMETPAFDLQTIQSKSERQDGVVQPIAAASPGVKSFNTTDLIQRGLYDIAAYFLGRPVTAEEKLAGMSKRALPVKFDADGEIQKQTLKELEDRLGRVPSSAEKAAELRKDSGTQAQILAALGRLVTAAERAPAAPSSRPRTQPPDDSNQGEPPMFIGAEPSDDGEQKEDVGDWPQELVNAFLDTYTEAELDDLQHTGPANWSRAQRAKFEYARDQLDYNAPIDDLQSIDPTEIATVINAPQGGNYKMRPQDLIPTYDPDKSYIVKDMVAILDELRFNNPGMKEAGVVPSKQSNKLFQIRPKLKSELDQHLKDVIKEVIQWKQDESVRVPLAGNGLVLSSHARTYSWVPFGKWLIAKNKLDDEDQFVLSRPKGFTKIHKHPNRTVSAALKIALQHIIDKKPVPFEILSPQEKLWLDFLMEDAKILVKKKVPEPLLISRTPRQTKQRLRDLVAQITQGPNDNPALREEFKDLFRRSCSAGGMTEAEIIKCQEFIATF